ncbi:MAG: helix-turn-helix domain-containing protein [archaeon]
MWTAKISFEGKNDSLIGKYAQESNVRILLFPLSWSDDPKGVLVHFAGNLFGDEKSKKKFIRLWKKDKCGRFLDIELNEDFFVGTGIEYMDAKEFYNKNIIFTQPFLVEDNLMWTIVVSSFEKKYLEKLINVLEKFHKVKIHYIQKKKIKNISFRAEALELSRKQKESIDLAIRNGYYDFPRKTSVKKLAKLSGLGFTTFHTHLRKAEQKLMPFFYSQ